MDDARREIDAIRVVTVTGNGADVGFTALCTHLASVPPTAFVALDAEFSGLPSDPATRHDDLQTRYAALRAIADTRAIFSFGLSIFIPTPSTSGSASAVPHYSVATYDFLTSCQCPYQMVPAAASFLEAHGFDFNTLFRSGIPYTRASTKPVPDNIQHDPALAAAHAQSQLWGKLPYSLFWQIGRRGVPLVLHNGLFDLVFLFAAFQAPLPPTLDLFITQLLSLVPAGIYDTKVLSTTLNPGHTFLSYVFAKSVLHSPISVSNATGLPDRLLTQPPEISIAEAKDVLCALFAFKGICPRGTACPFSHDVFKLIESQKTGNVPKDAKTAYKIHKQQSKSLKKERNQAKADLSKMSKKQKKRFLSQAAAAVALASAIAPTSNVNDNNPAPFSAPHRPEDPPLSTETDSGDKPQPMDVDTTPTLDEEPGPKQNHTSGWDAFCTGYIFASIRATRSPEELEKSINQICLSGKRSTLLLKRSLYADLDSTKPSPSNGADISPTAPEAVAPEVTAAASAHTDT